MYVIPSPSLRKTSRFQAASEGSQGENPNVARWTETTSWIESAQRDLREKQSLSVKIDKDAMRFKLRDLSKKLYALIRENESRDEMEKLDRHEFVVDVKGRDKCAKETEAECARLRSEMEMNAARNVTESDHIRRKYWDSMAVQQCHLKSLDPSRSASLPNFPIKLTNTADERRLQVAKFLRISEINDIRRNANKASRSGLLWTCLVQESASKHHDQQIQTFGVESK